MTASLVGKRFGVIDDDVRRAMSGLEFVQGLVDGTLPLNTMAQTLGYDVVEVSKGRVVAAAEPHAGHRNPAGTVHGGLAATLLDTCMGLAVLSMLDQGFAQTTLEFKISFVRPITPQTGLVKAEGKIIACGRRGRHRGRKADGQRWPLARSRHDDVPDLRALNARTCLALAPSPTGGAGCPSCM
jgi:uncharacterized protein (TIGR00369 family)